MSFAEGQVLDGKYVIQRRIAEGGMSTVYLGVNRRIGKSVAVKVLHPRVAEDAELVNRFEREACIVSRIRSANVADVYDFGELPSGECFMVMEYLDGESLATKLDREGTLSPATLAPIAEQILLALAAAHEVGVVHRDLKPENVLLTTTPRSGEITAKLVDFGISKVLPYSPWLDIHRSSSEGVASKVDLRLTSFNSVLGTPLYMAPEQVQSGVIDGRTDLYALGVILYEATSGEMPLIGDDVNELLLRVVLDEPEPLERRTPGVDPAWSAIVRRALAKSPCARYQSADEMREAIRAWSLRYRTATAYPIAIGQRTFASSSFPPLASSAIDDDEEPPPNPISIDGLATNARKSTVRPSILVEVSGQRRAPASGTKPSRTAIRRWPLVAGFGLALVGALMAEHAWFASHQGSPGRGGESDDLPALHSLRVAGARASRDSVDRVDQPPSSSGPVCPPPAPVSALEAR